MTLMTIADITPNGAAVQLSTVLSARATWIKATAIGTSIRYGDANVGPARGALLQTGVPTNTVPRDDFSQSPVDLASVWFYGAGGGDKVSITYGV